MTIKRPTALRQAIIDFFKVQRCQKTVLDLLDDLSNRNLFPNKSSIYRQLEALELEGILKSDLDMNGVRNFFWADAKHHHHFVCSSCEIIQDIDSKDLELEIESLSRKLKRKGFLVKKHQFELIGLCKMCL